MGSRGVGEARSRSAAVSGTRLRGRHGLTPAPRHQASVVVAPVAPELCKVAATDPLNLVGVLSPGSRVPAVIGNAVLYRDGVPIASKEAGAVVLRVALEGGASVDDELTYHPPPRRAAAPPQVALPL